jgi:hypothetical protein
VSLDPILWALKDATVADSLERLVLVVLAEHAGSADGCTAFPSRDTISSLVLADPKTVQRVIQRLIKRRLIARGDQSAARYIRADRRPVVYDLLIPYSWFPNPERMNEERRKRGLTPLTPKDRPDIVLAPSRARRKDLGVPRPKKVERGDSQSPRQTQEQTGHGGTVNPARGDSQSRTGGLEDPRTSYVNLPSGNHPSLSPPPSPEPPAAAPVAGEERETIAASPDKPTSTAQRVVRAAAVVTAEEEPAFIAWATTVHQPRGGAWWRAVAANGDLPDLADEWRAERAPAPAQRPPARVIPEWCGQCDGEPIAQRWQEGDDGRVRQCPRCHPDAIPTHADKRAHQPYKNPVDQSAYNRDLWGRPLPGTDTRVAGWLALPTQLQAEETQAAASIGDPYHQP